METKVIMPQLGESIAEGTVTKWFKKPGDTIKRDEALFEVSTDKVDSEIPSPASGVLVKILAEEGKTVAVNSVVAIVETEAGAATAAKAPAAVAPAPQPQTPAPPPPARPVEAPTAVQPQAEVRSSPLVRRIARENKVDLTTVPGSGVGGRITKRDIMAVVDSPAAAVPAAAPAAQPKGIVTAGAYGSERREPMGAMRRSIAEHMVASKRLSPHVTTVFEVDLSAVARSRESRKGEFKAREGFALTYMPYIAMASVQALKKHPIVNSSVGEGEVIYKEYVNLGIAVALEGGGLIVPVIKNADEKNFLGIARAIRQLADAARTKKLSPADVQGGTFTITNPGVFGSLFGTPIINQPQTAILGVGVIEKRAVVIEDMIAIRPMVYLSLSFDHRVIDGALADPFMAEIKRILQEWDDEG